MDEPKKTCGEFYRDAIQKYGTDEATYWAFAAGFVSGQAEKVMLGACQAAMLRPSQEKASRLVEIVGDVFARYGLTYFGFDGEIWIYVYDAHTDLKIRAVMVGPRDTPAWHSLRADLCGVSLSNFDPKFHERQGYGEDCDQVKSP